MKLGFVSAILPELSFEQVLRFAQREGFACAEIMGWPAGRAERKFAGVTHWPSRSKDSRFGATDWDPAEWQTRDCRQATAAIL